LGEVCRYLLAATGRPSLGSDDVIRRIVECDEPEGRPPCLDDPEAQRQLIAQAEALVPAWHGWCVHQS
jgi:hypothetical protein